MGRIEPLSLPRCSILPVFHHSNLPLDATDMNTTRHAEPSAFTLIELIITIVVIGIVLGALMRSFHEALKFMAGQKDTRRAALLCDDLMSEIRVKQFSGGATGGIAVRADCVGVEDYHLWSESPPQTMEGSVMSNLTGFTRSAIQRIQILYAVHR